MKTTRCPCYSLPFQEVYTTGHPVEMQQEWFPMSGKVNKVEEFIWYSADIGEGYSGGPLLNSDGVLVGINTQVTGLTAQAIPIDEAINTVSRWMDMKCETPKSLIQTTIGVMPFEVWGVDTKLQEVLRNRLNSILNNNPHIKVYSKEHIDLLIQTEFLHKMAAARKLGLTKMISGDFFLMEANTIRIEIRVIDVQTGLLETSEFIDGQEDRFLDLQEQIAAKIIASVTGASLLGETDVQASSLPAPRMDILKLLSEAEGEVPVAESLPEHNISPQDSTPEEDDELSTLPILQIWSGMNLAWAEELPQQEISPEEEIRWTLDRFRRAYEQENIVLLDAVYGGMTPRQRKANETLFQHTEAWRMTIRDVDIKVRGDEAVASYTREDHFIDAETGDAVGFEQRFTRIFVRQNGEWKMTLRKK